MAFLRLAEARNAWRECLSRLRPAQAEVGVHILKQMTSNFKKNYWPVMTFLQYHVIISVFTFLHKLSACACASPTVVQLFFQNLLWKAVYFQFFGTVTQPKNVTSCALRSLWLLVPDTKPVSSLPQWQMRTVSQKVTRRRNWKVGRANRSFKPDGWKPVI